LLTRPQAQSERFAQACRERLGEDLSIVISPLMSIRYMDVDVDLRDVEAVVATSANGIEGLAQRCDLKGLDAICVGDATAAAARAAGMCAVSAEGDATALIALIRAQRPKGALLYVRGTEVRTDLAAALADAGIAVRSAIMYDQRQIGLNGDAVRLLQGKGSIVLPLFSPRSAALAAEACAPYAPRLRIDAISEAVADAWTGPLPDALTIARRPDGGAMIDTVAHLYDGASS